MEGVGREEINEEMYETVADEKILDISEAAFLTPRLAVFTDGDYQDVESLNESNGDLTPRAVSARATRAEEDLCAVQGDTREAWKENIAHSLLLDRDEMGDEQLQHHFDHDETAPIAGVSFPEGDENGDEDNVMNYLNDDEEEDEDEDEDEDAVVNNDDVHLGAGSGASPNAAARDDRPPAFALSRVRELLKFHSLSSIVAKSAAVTASDAVVLMLRDLTRLAVAEAERQQRKTVTYVDIARVVHFFDRFSFLSDIIPQPPETHSGAARVIVGTGKAPTPLPSKAGGSAARVGRSSAHDGASQHQTNRGATTQENSRLRQATLRF